MLERCSWKWFLLGKSILGHRGLPSTLTAGRAPLCPLSPAQEQIKALGIYLLAGCRTLALSDGAFHPY